MIKNAVLRVSASAFMFACLPAHGADLLVPGRYPIDRERSSISFKIRHFAITKTSGQFTSFSGEVRYGKSVEDSSVRATAQTSSIDTDNPKRDEHLRSKDFFEAEKFPTLSFQSAAILGSLESFKMIGKLMIKGIEKEAVFNCKTVVDPETKAQTIEGETAIDRRDFGITEGGMIGNEVQIRVIIALGKREK